MAASSKTQPPPVRVASSPAESQPQIDRVVVVCGDEDDAGFRAKFEAAPDFAGDLVDADGDAEGAGGFRALVLELGAGDVVDAGEVVDFWVFFWRRGRGWFAFDLELLLESIGLRAGFLLILASCLAAVGLLVVSVCGAASLARGILGCCAKGAGGAALVCGVAVVLVVFQ